MEMRRKITTNDAVALVFVLRRLELRHTHTANTIWNLVKLLSAKSQFLTDVENKEAEKSW